MFKIGLCAVMIGASVILVLAVAMIVLGPAPGQGLAVVFLVPPSLVLIACGLPIGIKRLPEQGLPRTGAIVILSCGGAVGASVVLWVLFLMIR